MTTRKSSAFVSRSQGQIHFVGPSLFLRPVEPDDAATAPIWSPHLFPAPVEVMRERIENELGTDSEKEVQHQRMLVCRRMDDRPVGSVLFEYDHERECVLMFAHDPNRSLDEWAATECEVMHFTVPWLIEKRNLMKVYSWHMGEFARVTRTAKDLGMRLAFRLREAVVHHDRRYDQIGYELLNPDWISTLGMPRGLQEGPVERKTRSPARFTHIAADDLPATAIIASERLYLRAFDPEEATRASQWLLADPEDSHPGGPDVINPWTFGREFVEIAKEHAPSWVRFAIVLRENDKLIGVNGLTHLDLLSKTAETETTIFRPEFRNKGYGTEAKHLLLEYAFQRVGLHMVYSWVSEFNKRSAAALIKQGYREAGYFAWSEPYKGNYVGGWYFDYLAREWRATRIGSKQ